eukprot:scaffold222553_cov22-Tisochrysis_lutea.AAC.1
MLHSTRIMLAHAEKVYSHFGEGAKKTIILKAINDQLARSARSAAPQQLGKLQAVTYPRLFAMSDELCAIREAICALPIASQYHSVAREGVNFKISDFKGSLFNLSLRSFAFI